MKFLDNKTQGKVADALAENIRPDAHLSILSGIFSIYGYTSLKRALSRIRSLRLLIPGGNGDAGFSFEGLAGSDIDRRFRNRLDMAAVARECAQWIEKKAAVKAVSVPVPQNLIHVENRDGSAIAISGSSLFTSSGLGILPAPGYEMNSLFSGAQETRGLLEWFDAIWNNPETARDVKTLLLSRLAQLYSATPPERIYFLTLFHIFRDFLGEISEEKIIRSRTGIKETLTWSKLYKFQRDGVIGAIDKIERYNGCIIADSVGLGKTFEALAIIKYYELRNDRVLVLCPKKLRENWTLFTVNDKRNIFAGDRFNYDVLNHTDLSRTRGRSGEINLETLNWGNYDLVVIDESHNFRNNPPRKDGLTRYGRLMREIIRSGVKTKVLMLSATPVNNRMNDLKNQVAFIIEGQDDALASAGVQSIEQTLKIAQTRFNQWLKTDESLRTAESLLDALNFDYFKLLDLLTIARSRKHIEKYYDMKEIGAFPERAKPINIQADIDTENRFPRLEKINRDIRRLNLSAYSPLKYVLSEKVAEYSRKYDMQVSGGSVFKQIDREQSLIHLMRVNLFKRMESSINSFALTLEKLLAHVQDLIARIDTHAEMDVEEMSIEEIETESEEFAPLLIGSKVKVLIQDMDRIRWNQELEEDEAQLAALLEAAQAIGPERDEKLARLKKAVAEKVANPFNPGNQKVLIFTAFADTAAYLYQQMARWALEELGIYSALVTGRTGENRATMDGLSKDLWAILSAFSPVSKEREKIDTSPCQEIDLLIATDCISEGQNLQDCDCLINYDIHWNPVRIIQRFGRIDRLGSRNKTVQLINFWPNMELDEYINLEARVSGRMILLDISATGEENIIEFTDAGKMNDLTYRRKQLEQLQNEVVNLEDLSSGISITDLTLNDFRMDLAEYLKENREELESMAPGAFAVVRARDFTEARPGVIFCLKRAERGMEADSTNPLSPYSLVFVSDGGEVMLSFTQSKKILDLFKQLSMGRSGVDEEGMALFNSATKEGSEMGFYRDLLAKAVAAITGKAEEKGVESLFKRGGTALSRDSFKGIDDFEVIAYLILIGEAGA